MHVDTAQFPPIRPDPGRESLAETGDRTFALYYVVDPMCSWCWGFREPFALLRRNLPEGMAIDYVMGGLAPDSEAPMPVPLREQLQLTWQAVAQRTGARFNHDFWDRNTPRRSTWPACRAVIAASMQDARWLEPMLDALQRAYYEQARNPAEREVLIAVAGEVGLDADRFTADLDSAEAQAALQAQMRWARAVGADGFPSLLLGRGGRLAWVTRGYIDADVLVARMRSAFHALGEGEGEDG